MAARCKQASKDLAAYTKSHVGHISYALSNHTEYSTSINSISAPLRRSYSIIDGLSVFVWSNQTSTPTTWLLIHIEYPLGIGKAKRQLGGPDITEWPMSKAQDLVILRVKHTLPGYVICQKLKCLNFLGLQLFLITCLLFFNAQYQVLYQNAKSYYQAFILSNLWKISPLPRLP